VIGLSLEQAFLIGCLLLAIGLTAWGAASLGNPDRPLPRRPLPRPRPARRHQRKARHSTEGDTRPLAWPAPEHWAQVERDRLGRPDVQEWPTFRPPD
jgi:hypothetical protein